MNKALFTCKNCGNKFYEKDAIKVKQGYHYIISCPKCNTLRPAGTMSLDVNKPIEEGNLNLKFKAGDRVFNKATREWVNIIEFDIETGLYIVRYDDGIRGRSLESELCEGMETKPKLKFKVGDIIAKAHLRFRIVKVESDRYIVEERPGINLEVFFTDQDEYRLVKEEGMTTVDKAAEVFADMLIELCPELLGFGGAAKEWENEFRKRLEE